MCTSNNTHGTGNPNSMICITSIPGPLSYWRRKLSKFGVWSLNFTDHTYPYRPPPPLSAIPHDRILLPATFGHVYVWKHKLWGQHVTLSILQGASTQHYKYSRCDINHLLSGSDPPSSLNSTLSLDQNKGEAFFKTCLNGGPSVEGTLISKTKGFYLLTFENNRKSSLPLSKPQPQGQIGSRYAWFSHIMLDLLVSSSK